MRFYFGIPRERGWPGDHDVSLEGGGHLWPRWSAIRIESAGVSYSIGATPWQLIRLAYWQIVRRVRLFALRCVRVAKHNTLNAAKRWITWMTHLKKT